MEFVKEILLLYGRVFTIVPLLLIAAFIIGKRSVSELSVFDLLLVIALGAIAGANLADPNIGHIHTAIGILTVSALQRLISWLIIKKRVLGRLITFEPTVVVRNGIFLVDNIRRIRYSVDHILQMLRERDIFDISEVDLALVEANGKLTVHKIPSKLNITPEDMGIHKNNGTISYPVIVEGKIYPAILDQLDLNERWLRQQLQKKGLTDLEEIFFASVNKNKELHISLMKQVPPPAPEMKH